MKAESSADAFDIVRAHVAHGEPAAVSEGEEGLLLESMAELRARIRRARSLSSRFSGITLSPHVLHAARHARR
jgi:hypothetical protein